MTTGEARRRAPRTKVTSHSRAKPAKVREPNAARSQNQIAYETLKEAIVTLRLKPSEYLNCAQLADTFRLSRTPVMRALDRLMTEGLVNIIPRKGVAVAPLSLDDAFELADVRMVNEGYCLELAAQRIDHQSLKRLHDILQRYDDAATTVDVAVLLQMDRDFHETIAIASGNRILANVLSVLHVRSQRFWALAVSRRTHIKEVAIEHREILRCLEAHDPNAARQALNRHVLSFRRNLLP